MITDNNKKLAQWAMDFALKNGCQAAKVVLYANSNTSFELRDAKNRWIVCNRLLKVVWESMYM